MLILKVFCVFFCLFSFVWYYFVMWNWVRKSFVCCVHYCLIYFLYFLVCIGVIKKSFNTPNSPTVNFWYAKRQDYDVKFYAPAESRKKIKVEIRKIYYSTSMPVNKGYLINSQVGWFAFVRLGILNRQISRFSNQFKINF